MAALTSNGVGTCGADDNQAQAGHFVVHPIAVRGREGGAELEIGPEGGPYNCLRAGDGGSSRNQLVSITGPVTHALTSEGADASEDGTGRGTPIVTYSPDVAAPLTAGTAASSGVNPPGRRQEDDVNIIAFDWQTAGSDRTRPNVSTERTSAIGVTNRDAVAIHENQRCEITTTSMAGTLKTGGGKPGRGYPAVMAETVVRRLTELECERLQGYPDGWTDEQSGAARYRQLGNSVAVPVVEWIARRLIAVDAAALGGLTVLHQHREGEK